MVPPSSPPERNDGAGRAPVRHHAPERSDSGEAYRGLCANCVYRETCLLPDSEGGVWHCEKYAENADEAWSGPTITNGNEE
jgi:hypothetical protein